MPDVCVAICRNVIFSSGKRGLRTLNGRYALTSSSSDSLPSCTSRIIATPVTVLLIDPMFITVSAVNGTSCAWSACP